ncbi:MAG TPA: hypothetical protein VH682_06290 [Gemmataceae bacterium]|jgi:hypothetical protein
MNKLLLLLLCATVLIALSLAFLGDESATSGSRCPHNSLSLREILRILVSEEQRRSVLEEEGSAVLLRIQDRQEIAARVIARRMTLQEAAVCFRSLNAEQSKLREEMFLAGFPGACEEERLCRQVIAWVSNALLDDPARRTVEVARLEAEVNRRFSHEDKSSFASESSQTGSSSP